MWTSFASYRTLNVSYFILSASAIVPPAYWNIFPDLRLVAINGSESSIYFPHSNTSGWPQLDDAPASAMAVFTFLLRTFHLISTSFISAFLAMATTYQVCSGVVFHPVGAGGWLMKFRLAFSLTWQGGGSTGDSGFRYNFAIRLMLATFIHFCFTIFYCPVHPMPQSQPRIFPAVPIFSSSTVMDLPFSIFCQPSSALCWTIASS